MDHGFIGVFFVYVLVLWKFQVFAQRIKLKFATIDAVRKTFSEVTPVLKIIVWRQRCCDLRVLLVGGHFGVIEMIYCRFCSLPNSISKHARPLLPQPGRCAQSCMWPGPRSNTRGQSTSVRFGVRFGDLFAIEKNNSDSTRVAASGEFCSMTDCDGTMFILLIFVFY